MTTLEQLAARCEAATGPDRELDALIAAAQGMRAVNEGHPLGWQCYDAADRIAIFPRYTASLDAAMTLVPEGAWWWVEAQPLVHGKFLAGCGDERVSTAATPSLALTAASLRARAAS